MQRIASGTVNENSSECEMGLSEYGLTPSPSNSLQVNPESISCTGTDNQTEQLRENMHISSSTYVHICTLFVSFAVCIYYFNCISFAILPSGRKVAIKLIDWLMQHKNRKNRLAVMKNNKTFRSKRQNK